MQKNLKRTMLKRALKRFWPLYLMMIPGFLYLLVYRYGPMLGISLAFQDYRITRSVFKSPFVGFDNFEALFRNPNFGMIVSNTIIISLMKIAFGFPAPILLAVMLNDLRNTRIKRILQTMYYLPHFISWIVIGNLVFAFIAPNSGAFSHVYMRLTGKPQLDIMMNPEAFRPLLVITDIWKECGWSSIIYLATITSIDPTLYEAAVMDGANHGQQMQYITLPSLVPTIMTMLLLRVGHIMSAGFDQIWVLQNDMVYKVSEVLDTYIYKVSFLENKPSLGAASGLFTGVIGLVMVILTNKFAGHFDQGVL